MAGFGRPWRFGVLHLGDTHDAAGNTGSARVAWRQALRIRTELNHPDTDDIVSRLQHLGGESAVQPGLH